MKTKLDVMDNKVRLGKPLFKLMWKQRYLQLLVGVGLVYLLIFSYIPMFGILMAFKKYNISMGITGIFTSPWVGFKYFTEFVTDYNFLTLLRNTLVLSIAKLVFTFPIPIIFAVMLNEIRNKSIKKVVQTASYLPYFISWIVVAGFVMIFLSSVNGIVNDLLLGMHLVSKPIEFMTNPNYFWGIAIVTAIWKDSGWWAIIFLAAITSIDQTMYEAAEIDGAGRLKRLWSITIPGIKGTITIVFILALGNLLGGGLSGSNFEQSFLLGNAGNIGTSDIIQTYVLRVGLSEGRYAYSTAVGLMQSIISVVLIFSSNFVSKKISGNGLF